MDKLIFERIWDDYDFYELKITASSDIISATTKVYVISEEMDILSKGIENFIHNNDNTYFWEICEKGNNPYCSLNFIKKDMLGHFYVEIYMDIDDFSNLKKHNCCFYINTELGLLLQFAKKVKNLNDYSKDIIVSLNNN